MSEYPLGLKLTVEAGPHDRRQAPVCCPLPSAAPEGAYLLQPEGRGERIVAQCLSRPTGSHLLFLLPELPAGEALRLTVAPHLTDEVLPGVTLTPGEHRWDFAVRDEFFTSYVTGPDLARPYCYPVRGPGGLEVTNLAPGDHVHHKSLYIAQGSVNGWDNWSELPHHARTVNQECRVLAAGPVCAELYAQGDWESPSGEKLLAEHLRLRVLNLPGEARLMDWDITWSAEYGGVFFGDTKEAGQLSVRVAASMEESRGGRITNGLGCVGEAECWGRPAPWVDYTGPVEGRTLGIALLDRPGNFRYPTPWHVRSYGLFTANCWGLHDFTGDWSVRGDHALAAGESLHWRYRMLIHEGTTEEAAVAAHWLNFAFPAQARVE